MARNDAPGLCWRNRRGWFAAYWICRRDIAKAGYPLKTQMLWMGPSKETANMTKIAATCRRLQQEMYEWKVNAERKRRDRTHTYPGFVYFFGYEDRIKIGFTGNVRQRLSQIQTVLPGPLKLMGTIPETPDFEKFLHRKFRHLRDRGEWFRAAPELLDFILISASEQTENRVSNRCPNDIEQVETSTL